ncbi:hypothetical protein Tco_1001210 [Tanacetum coccineum]
MLMSSKENSWMIYTTNAFNGTNGKDAVEHIEYYLKIIDLINLPNVDHDKLRVVVFPISLAGGARRWFDKTKESITCWVDLTAKFFGKYYPPSRIEGNNTPDYWKTGGDEIEIETDVFDYETPLCLAFNEFNYLLKVDPDLLTKDIMGFKTYEDYKDDWIYEWNENVPWVYDKPWLDNGIWKEPKPVKHTCKPFNYKTGAYHIGNSLHYQDLEWYEALEDSELKDEAIRNKAIMEVITEYLVNISKRRAFWSLNEDILKINDSDYQYAVSIKEDTAYPCLHSPKDHKGNKLNTSYPEKTNTPY